MNQRILSMLTTISIVVIFVLSIMPASANNGFAGGSGSLSDPYLISNETQLRNMANYLSSNFKLTNDIPLSYSWTPIGKSSPSTAMFSGTFDGNHFSIKNLNISGTSYQALFGYTNNASIVNLNIVGSTINASSSYTGSIVGYAKGTLYLTNCTSNATIYGKSYTGGLVGYSQNALITNCTFSGSVSATVEVGGILGKASKSTSTAITVISKSRVIAPNGTNPSTARISGTTSVGGIVGSLTGRVEQSYSTVKVSGSSEIGGIAGDMLYTSSTTGQIYDSYSTGEIYASTSGNAGGIVGDAPATSTTGHTVERCYSTSVIYSAKGQYTGGIVGDNGTSSTYSYVNKSVALNTSITQSATSTSSTYVGKIGGTAYGYGTNYALSTTPVYNGSKASTLKGNNGSSVTEATAQTQSFYQNTLGWNFSTVWIMDATNSKYPTLRNWYSPPAEVGITSDIDFNSVEIKVGMNFTLAAQPSLSNDTIKGWKFDTQYLSMETNGNSAIFTAIKDTTSTTITVETTKGASKSISITISKKPPEPTDIEYITLALEMGQTANLGGVTYGKNSAEHIGYTWSNDNSEVLTVTKNGKVTAVGLGIDTVTMSKDGESYSMNILVREKPTIDMEEIKFTQENIDLTYGTITTLSYNVYPEDTTNKSVLWESDNENVVLIGEKNGKLSIIGSGIATITVRCAYNNDIQATIVVNATKPVTNVEIDMPEITEFKAGETLQLSAQAFPDDATDTNITWSCSPEGIVSIDEHGLVTGLSAGKVKIYATAGGTSSAPLELRVLSEFEEISLAEFKKFSDIFEPENRYYALGGLCSYTTNPDTAAYIDLIGTENSLTTGALIRAKNWLDSSESNPKAWMATIPTNGCTSFNVSFTTRSGNANNRVTEFALQYSVDGITWNTIKNYSITDEFATYGGEFSTGSTDKVYIRWLGTSNSDNLGVKFKAAGNNIMKDILITGIK